MAELADALDSKSSSRKRVSVRPRPAAYRTKPEHLTFEMFNRAVGITMTHVPYKGGPPAVIDTISGRTHFVITTVIPVSRT